MLATGFMIFLGVTLILVKLPRRLMLRALHHDVAVDLLVSALVLAIHFGTFSGVMAATVAGLLMSIATSSMKRMMGHIKDDVYYPGMLCLKV